MRIQATSKAEVKTLAQVVNILLPDLRNTVLIRGCSTFKMPNDKIPGFFQNPFNPHSTLT
jgi:hypothetical protein